MFSNPTKKQKAPIINRLSNWKGLVRVRYDSIADMVTLTSEGGIWEAGYEGASAEAVKAQLEGKTEAFFLARITGGNIHLQRQVSGANWNAQATTQGS